MMRRANAIRAVGLSALGLTAAAITALPAAAQDDRYLWLEEVEGNRAMEWVLDQNARTRAELRALPAYQKAFDNTMAILTSDDRIAFPSMRGDWLYNF